MLTLRQLLDAYQGQEAVSKKYVRDYLPMFRDSDAQGLIGARAYLYYFQDMSTLHLHQMEKEMILYRKPTVPPGFIRNTK